MFPTLLDDLDALRDTLFMPLVDAWIKMERFKIEEHPTILGFDVYHCSPYTDSSTVSIHNRILPAVFPFIEKLCLEREELYKEARCKMNIGGVTVDSRRKVLKGSHNARNILPFNITIAGLRGDNSFQKVSLPRRMAEYVDTIVLEGPSAKLASSSDRWDWYPGQLSLALDSHLSYSATRDEIDRKITKLWHLYGPSGNQPDLRSALLVSNIVQAALWSRPNLMELVLPWLPEFPPKGASENIDFNPLSLLPPNLPKPSEDEESLLILRVPEASQLVAFNALLSPFLNSTSDTISLRKMSRNAMQRVAVFTVAWILTTLEVPRDLSLAASDDTGPVAYAVRNVRLHGSFLEELKTRRHQSIVPSHLLHGLLPSLSYSEVDLLARAVFSAPKTPTNDIISMSILGVLRSLGVPRLASERAFHVFEDVEASSWHRQTLTPRTIGYCQPQEARDSMKRIMTYTQDRHRQQKERQKERRKNAKISGVAESSEGQVPLLKTSTHKMAMQLLKSTALEGSIDANFIEECVAEGLLETPSGIRSYAVDVLTTVVQDLFIITGDERGTSSGMWGMLSPFINVAQHLNEDVFVTEEQWAAARAGTGPMPEIVEERHVAQSLLSFSNMSPSLKRAWAEKVAYPVITGHLHARTRWLRTAIAREGGSKDLEDSAWAISGSGIPVSAYFQMFAPSLPENKSLLEILEREGLGFICRPTCQNLLDLMGKNHESGWERETYGKNVKLITDYAVSDLDSAGGAARSAIHATLVKPNVPTSLVEDCLASLKRIGLTLLQPENAQVHTNLAIRAPYSSFRRFVVNILAPSNAYSLDPNVVYLLSEYLKEAESSEKHNSATNLNGGANYWDLIIILKVSLIYLFLIGWCLNVARFSY